MARVPGKPGLSPWFAAHLAAIVVALAGAASAGNRESQDVTTIGVDTTIAADILVDSASTLRILPGVTIRFEGYRQLKVCGLLIAEGNADRQIRISSVDRPFGSDERPAWQGLVVTGPRAIARLRHCRIEGAYTNGFWQGQATIDSCEFVGNYRGLYFARGAQANLRGNRIYRNVYGVVVNLGLPMMLDNQITQNTVGVQLESGSAPVTGRNDIRYNTTDVRAEQAIASTDSGLPVKQLWDIMRVLY